ncbi:c-type cytochrome [Xanthobacter sp. AM11]|uniref:c-type cytochrome n=1 Tax=Xanthobacter sp. AM11 TaxID=3380643 RepID=UPI0039BFBFD1
MRSAVAAATAALLAAVFVAPSVLAQDNVIKRRQQAMKLMGEQADVGAAVMKGQAAFDAAKAATMFQTFKEQIVGYAALFPPGSDKGDTKALAAVWSDRKGFEAAIASFEKVVAENAAAGVTADGFKAAFTAVGGECRSCHQNFKAR